MIGGVFCTKSDTQFTEMSAGCPYPSVPGVWVDTSPPSFAWDQSLTQHGSPGHRWCPFQAKRFDFQTRPPRYMTFICRVWKMTHVRETCVEPENHDDKGKMLAGVRRRLDEPPWACRSKGWSQPNTTLIRPKGVRLKMNQTVSNSASNVHTCVCMCVSVCLSVCLCVDLPARLYWAALDSLIPQPVTYI